jgi:hypothetical protein
LAPPEAPNNLADPRPHRRNTPRRYQRTILRAGLTLKRPIPNEHLLCALGVLCVEFPSNNIKKPLFLAVFAHGSATRRYRNTTIFTRFEVVLGSKTRHSPSF